jgi:hypothetical protein
MAGDGAPATRVAARPCSAWISTRKSAQRRSGTVWPATGSEGQQALVAPQQRQQRLWRPRPGPEREELAGSDGSKSDTDDTDLHGFVLIDSGQNRSRRAAVKACSTRLWMAARL